MSDSSVVLLHSAARIVKAAAVQVLGIPVGQSTVKLILGCKSNTVELGLRTLLKTDAQVPEAVAQLQAAVQRLVDADTPLGRFTLPRVEAEATYGRAMYDAIGAPPTTETLNLVHIPDLLLNHFPGELLPSAGFLGRIEITKHKFQAKRQQLDLTVVVHDAKAVPAGLRAPPVVPAPTAAAIAFINQPCARALALCNYLTKQPLAHALQDLVLFADPKGAAKAKPPHASGAASEPASASPRRLPARVEPADHHQVVNPWEVSGAIDYEKLVVQFGCSRIIREDTVARVERLTGRRAHRFLRRGIFYTHRDLDWLLDAYERGEKFYLYTGRGPSSEALHLGHLVPFMFTQYLQEAFAVPLVIQLTDDEKFLWKDMPLERCHELGYANAKDILACGFDVRKTFIFSDLDYIGHMYPTVLKIQKLVTCSQSRGIFGLTPSDSIGKQAFPAVQAAPSFSEAFQIPLRGQANMNCLIPQAIDQDPYFRMARDIAPRAGWKKPALIHSKFFPALQGSTTKMSSSAETSAVFVSDTPEQITSKIKKHALSGGQETVEKHRELGANIEVDVAYQYLSFFLEDDAELERIGTEYKAGRMLTAEVKQILIGVLTPIVQGLQERRKAVTDATLAECMRVRPLEF